MAQRGAVPVGRLSQDSQQAQTPQWAPVSMQQIDAAAVAEHNHAGDCWVLVHSYALEITGYLDRHSGGRSALIPLCGTDGTTAFDNAGHPFSYVTLMAERGFAYIHGCVDCGSGPPQSGGVGSGSPALSPTPTPTTQTLSTTRACSAEEPVPPAGALITPTTLQQHSRQGDCWMVLGCGVYDVSNYVHSGGDVHLSFCGRDGTASFSGMHPWNYMHALLQRGAVLKGRLESAAPAVTVGRARAISMEEISRHNTAQDCWSCIAGKVYELHYYLRSHAGGAAVILPMCGNDATTYLLAVHAPDAMRGLPTRGSCNNRADQAFAEQNMLDGAAALLYFVPPMLLTQCRRGMGLVMRDRCLRRPMRSPFAKGWRANLLNPYLEMPPGVAFLLAWFLIVTAALTTRWFEHYYEYYPEDTAAAGAVGRVTIYQVALATLLGTRRWSLSWMLWHVPYEKTLKAHYVVGMVAGLFILLHGALYIGVFGALSLPEHQNNTAYFLLMCTLIVLPPAMVTNFRVRFYAVFRITHFAAPMLVLGANAHLLSMSVDGVLNPGMVSSLAWLSAAAALWVFDWLHATFDAFVRPVEILDGPRVLPVDSDERYIVVSLRKARVSLFPGAWLQVLCPQTQSPLSHPFTAIVRRCGGVDREPAELEFVWKVNPGRTWTQQLHDKVVAAAPQGKLPGNDAVQPRPAFGAAPPDRLPSHDTDQPWPGIKNSPFSFFLTGPFGGGLDDGMKAMKVIVFITAGVGVTPAASMTPHLLRRGKHVHVVWAARSAALISHVAGTYFDRETEGYYEKHPSRRVIHYTGAAGNEEQILPPYVHHGRPKIADILARIAEQAQEQKIYDLGVFVCGPRPLVRDALAAADATNKALDVHVHVHSESF